MKTTACLNKYCHDDKMQEMHLYCSANDTGMDDMNLSAIHVMQSMFFLPVEGH
jgi:hypothetical protein